MGQKIVVTAKMKALEDTSLPEPVVVYHWNWRRVGLASVVVGTIILATVWGVFTVVNANEITNETVALDFAPEKVPNVALSSEFNLTQAQEVSNAEVDLSIVLGTASKEPLAADSVNVVLDDVEETMPDVESQLSIETSAINAAVDLAELSSEDAIPNEVQPVSVVNPSTIELAALSQVSRGVEIDTDYVSRALLTIAVEDREPVDVLGSEVYTNQFTDQLYFFTEVNNFTPQQVSHVWFYNGVQEAEVLLDITSTHFRTYSSKKITSQQMGDWQVQLRDSNQQILAQKTFRIINKHSNL
ncbi:DUF2914 domain-containing protein [Pseudoalteromonas tunicata]|uniref:DUF2914 domain-containing protein n=1 Tax=Pseudoalteromonas tunicata TaxID=314281 RepID=UPI00273F13BD|nr:DUF2914 domain-containing protein [Pseudoalteromonas tunicata]MDP4985224.1 DUF2914 domain-containing protein [Pseudoalteromonas tunicata]